MHMLRALLIIVVAALIGTGGLTASAQSTVPNLAYVRESTGQVFVVSGGQRHAVPLYPASDAEIAAIPSSGQWMVPKVDGSGYELAAANPWPAAPPAAAAAGAALTINGDGQQNTRPFELAGGNYTVKWDGRSSNQFGGNLIMTLKRVDGPGFGGELLVNLVLSRDKSSASGETQVYNVKPGQHYLDVMAPGPWSVTITPL